MTIQDGNEVRQKAREHVQSLLKFADGQDSAPLAAVAVPIGEARALAAWTRDDELKEAVVDAALAWHVSLSSSSPATELLDRSELAVAASELWEHRS